MSGVKALVDEIERAEGPSRELDGQIAKVTMPDKDWLPSNSYGPGVYANPNGSATACPRYTASIDAALTLVPEGWTLFHLAGPFSDNQSRSTVAGGKPIRFREGNGTTPALALCAAALRAKAGAK